jgi:Uma2 family endonuclease
MSKNRPPEKKVSYAEYLTWPDEPRFEIINGIPYMQAAPSRQHQRIVSQLVGVWYLFLKGKKCEVYTAPFDVRLAAVGDEEEYQVVLPDISVICDDTNLDDKDAKGHQILLLRSYLLLHGEEIELRN